MPAAPAVANESSGPVVARRNRRRARTSGYIAVVLAGLGTAELVWNLTAYSVGVYLVALLLAVLPLPFYVGVSLWMDRYEPEPLAMVAMTFFWGATGAVLGAILLNTHIGGGWAPVTEELLKAVPLLGIYVWRPDEFDGVLDGVLYGTLVGLGFTVSEDLIYYGNAVLNEGTTAAVDTFVSRGVLSAYGHSVFTAVTGLGLGLAVQSKRRALRLGAPALGLVGAILVHFVWDELPSTVDLFVHGPLLVAGWIALVTGELRRETRIVREHLAEEVDAGVLSARDVESLCSVRGRVRESIAAFRRGGLRGWDTHDHFQDTAGSLAVLRYRVAEHRHPDLREAGRLERAYEARLRELARGLPKVGDRLSPRDDRRRPGPCSP